MHKESNRAITIQQELKKMNIEVEFNKNVMLIHGNKNIKGAAVSSHHDHRIAMMCAVLALTADAETVIDNAEAINKSYPVFFENLQSANAITAILKPSIINHHL